MALPIAGLFGAASGVVGLFSGGESANTQEARNLLNRASSRPLEIPTLAANRTVSGGNNYSVDENGSPVSKTPAAAARDVVADNPEFAPVAIPGRTVSVTRSAFGATAGTRIQVYQTRAAADVAGKRQAEIDAANAKQAAIADAARAEGKSGFQATFQSTDPQNILDDFFNQLAMADREKNALPSSGAVPISGVTITADAPGRGAQGILPKSNLPIFLVIGGLGLLGVIAVIFATRN